jgi:tRNA nucleotidyltransferase/poly(A) polymerase
MRFIRFHSKFGAGEIEPKLMKTLQEFSNIHERAALERVREEFMKGLTDPEIDIVKYVKIYVKSGLMASIFPGMNFDTSVPIKFAGKRDQADKLLALAWILKDNSPEKVKSVLATKRDVNGKEAQSGWMAGEAEAVAYLLNLYHNFDPSQIKRLKDGQRRHGFSVEQIDSWVKSFHRPDVGHHHGRPQGWAKQVSAMARFTPKSSFQSAQESGATKCKVCRGSGCSYCGGKGEIPPHEREELIRGMQADEFQKHLQAS